MIKLIEQKGEWNALLEKMGGSDFYHTFEYNHLEKNKEERPVLVVYHEGCKTIALPLLIRKIPGSEYYDAISVSGYAGPISKSINETFDNTNFKKELKSIFRVNNIISVFSRLSPFVPSQEIVLHSSGEILTLGNVVNIDLTKSLENQRAGYQKRLKTYINKARRSCTVKLANTDEGLTQFIEIYYETMQRLNASPNYFFPRTYFEGLLQNEYFKVDILLAYNNENGELVAGGMFVKSNKIVQYHLSGTKSEYHHLNAIKLIIDEMRIRATKENYTYLNLGGGVGSKEDSLFRFKNSFSKDIKPFKIWKCICNDTIYEDLVRQKQEKPCSIFHKECADYFPCYRCDIEFDFDLSHAG